MNTEINPFDILSGKTVKNKWGIFYAKNVGDIKLNDIGWPIGAFHRENGPAAYWFDGSIAWCKNGKRHREDGPAIIEANGKERWYLHGIEYTEEKFNKVVNEYRNKPI